MTAVQRQKTLARNNNECDNGKSSGDVSIYAEIVCIEKSAYDRLITSVEALTSNVGMLLLAHERDDSLDRWLDSLEVYQLLHISPRTLHTMRDNGELPFSKFEGKIWYKRSEADALMIRNGINLNVYSHG